MNIDIGTNLTTVLMALIAAIGSIAAAFFAYNAASKTVATHNLVNGRMTELLALSNAASRAQGVAAGVTGDTTIPPIVVTPANLMPPSV